MEIVCYQIDYSLLINMQKQTEVKIKTVLSPTSWKINLMRKPYISL